MLTNLLSKNDCAKCKYCCIFDRQDFWELPLMNEETKQYLTNNDNSVLFENVGELYRLIPSFNKDNLYYCSALGEKGCVLSDDLKPFDCKIWPFRVMDYNGRIALTLSDGCNTINNISDDMIKDFVDSDFGDIVLHFAEVHREVIKPYVNGYKIYKLSD